MASGALEQNGDLLGRFPKVRAPLPPQYQAFHATFYQAAREGCHAGASLALKLERWMHRKALARGDAFPLLEIGAGTLNHVPFEPASGLYDVVEPMAILYEGKIERTRIRDAFIDIDKVPAERRYPRIISIAALEHITNLPEVVARSCLLLTPDGAFRSGIPSEGGLLWYVAYMFGTGTTFRLKYGLDYSIFQRYEHVNKASEIEAVIRVFFGRVRLSRFPLPSLHLSFYTFIDAAEPQREVALQYLHQLETRMRQERV